jgi:kumamolisin
MHKRLRRYGWIAVPVAAGLAAIAVVAVLVSSSAAVPPRGPALALRVSARSARELGPLPATDRLRLELQLANHRKAALNRLIASGRTVSPRRFAEEFLPPAGAVQRAVQRLAHDGLHPTWTPGASGIELDATAAAAEREFNVQLNRYQGSSGTFYAPSEPARLPPELAGVVDTVSGLDDETRLGTLQSSGSGGCGSTIGGYSPAQIMSAYNFGPLVHGSLNGGGQTVVFIEIDTFQQADLDCFAREYGEAAPSVSLGPQRWGSPTNSAGESGGESETDLDLEIVHAIAPSARLVVYYADSNTSDIAAAAQAAVQAYPHAILNVSIGGCEVEALSGGSPQVTPDQTAWNGALQRLAGTGGTAFIASGDSGAYTCGKDLVNTQTGNELLSVSYPASSPYATSVGGTALFLGAGGAYAGEAAWGGPFEADGSGGGLSRLWRKPAWQSGPGVTNSYSNGYREVPDVSAVGDPTTGWNIFTDGSWGVVAGTSAAAPLWAGLTALADQQLAGDNLQPVGFADPAIYAFGGNPARWPAAAFHDVKRGENLYYPAGSGWDFASGWGSPNAAGLVDDLVAYRRSNP